MNVNMNMFVPCCCVFTFFCLLILPSSTSGVSPSDLHALIALKNGFEQPEPALSSWNTSNPTSVCSWKGIQCLEGKIVSLDLTDLNLGGFVSPQISHLNGLFRLSLAGNNFNGTIEIGNMRSLEFLNISNNQFNGGMDWNYSTLGNLQVLDANNNNFTAQLPVGVVRLKEKLRHLDLGGNYFYGNIPPSYGSFQNLKYLFLAGNDLQGKIPSELGNLTELRELYLGYYNTWEGGIPKELGKLVNLAHLDISNCGLKGSIPKELGNLHSLDTLYLHINLLSGPIPSELGNLTSLVNLDLSNNALTGEIPFELSNLREIKLFNLFLNRLNGSVPDYLAELPNLETLALWMNNFTGTIPQSLGGNQKLQVLDLSSNKLKGNIPPDLCASKKLRILILFNNLLAGPIPAGLGSCSSLTRIRMAQNHLNGSIPSGFIYLPEVNLLELQGNFLTGNLTENSAEVSDKLAQLDLSNNLLSGSLPSSISSFNSLQILLLGGNRFSGPIPTSIGQLQQLTKLDLSHNAFSGTIPLEISKCDHLNYLDLSQNHLNGTIPTSIGSMKSLSEANFSFNSLSGELPESGQFRLLKASSFAGNPSLCGSILNKPCNTTQSPSTKPRKSPNGEFKLLLALGLFAFSLIFAIFAVIKARSFKQSSGNSWKMTIFSKVEFTIKDVLECVKDGNVIGRGGSGIVYHGKTPTGVEIAVKKLVGFGIPSTTSHDHGFRAEVQTLGSIRHRNIVKLLAFCTNKHTNTNLLVYEYMRNGSLGDALHGKKGGFVGWNLRYKIAVEAAKGLCYLHHDCSPLIVHRDVKSNNILLDSSFEAHVADFGLAKFLIEGGGPSQCMSAVAGSYGYIAPEYAYTLRVDEKSDVYSFGVVLLELLTGRRPVGDFGEAVDIVQWSKLTTNCRVEEVSRIVDSRLATVSEGEAMHLFFVAMVCVQENSVERPTMKEVVQMLSEFPRHSRVKFEEPSSSRVVDHKC